MRLSQSWCAQRSAALQAVVAVVVVHEVAVVVGGGVRGGRVSCCIGAVGSRRACSSVLTMRVWAWECMCLRVGGGGSGVLTCWWRWQWCACLCVCVCVVWTILHVTHFVHAGRPHLDHVEEKLHSGRRHGGHNQSRGRCKKLRGKTPAAAAAPSCRLLFGARL